MTQANQPGDGGQAAPAPTAASKQRAGRHPISPGGFVVLAAILAALYGLFHLLGWREHVSSVYATAAPDGGKVVMGLAYAAAYFGFVLAAPILALAAGIFALLGRILAGSRDPDPGAIRRLQNPLTTSPHPSGRTS